MNMELTPQQLQFAAFYLNPDSPTFSNATQSAIKAGFSEEYAKNITGQMPKWLSELLGKKHRLLSKAEKVLEETLEGEDKRIAQDSAKFIAKTIGREEYSERTEMTGKNGSPLLGLELSDDQYRRIISEGIERLSGEKGGD